MEAAVREEVGAYWSGTLGLPTDELHRAKVKVVPARTGNDGVVLLRIGLACVVVVEQEHVDRTSAVVASLDPDAVFNRATALSLAGADAEVHGPSWHGYVDRLGFRGLRARDVERLDPTDRRLVTLRDDSGQTEWREAGFPLEPSTADSARSAFYGLSVEGVLVAAGNLADRLPSARLVPARVLPSGRALVALQAAMGLLVLWIVVFIWTWLGMWSLEPDRYPDASAWWRHYALPRAAQALGPALVFGAVTGLLVGRALRRRT